MGYYTRYEVRVSNEFLDLYEKTTNELEGIEVHVEALRKKGIDVDVPDPKQNWERQVTDRVKILYGRKGTKIFETENGYVFAQSSRDESTFHAEGSYKFYEWESVFKELSEKVSGLFEVRGDGEEAGDLWRAYFLEGRTYTQEPVFPEFDPDKLK